MCVTGDGKADDSVSDEQCDVAIATLAQLLLQQNKVHEAVKMFEKSAEMARTEPELINALTYESATKAQIAFITAYPSYAEKVSSGCSISRG